MESSAREFITMPPRTIVDDRYEIEGCIGIGSMSVVYSARRLLDGERCALKVLTPVNTQEISSATFHTRFRIGARMAQLVVHPHVVRILDFIDRPQLLASVMEIVDGGDLAARLRTKGAYSIPEALRVLQQILSGVSAIHEAGIIHRDIKPANILLDKSGDAKISDFGIARSGDTPRLTAQGGIIGTIHYLSPEQLKGEQATQRSDIYALGIVAYEMVTGAVPGCDASVFKLVDQRVTHDAVPAHELNPLCPVALSTLIAKALQRDPAERFYSVTDMLAELEKITSGANENVIAAARPSPHAVRDSIKDSAAWRVFRGAGFQTAIAALLVALFVLTLRLPSRERIVAVSTQMRSGHIPAAQREPSASRANMTVPPMPLPGRASLQAPQSDTANISARQTLLYRLADYVRWPKPSPENSAVPLRLCILGKDPFGLNLDKILSKTRSREGRNFWLQRFESSAHVDMLMGCQILYLGAAIGPQTDAVISSLQTLPVLTVTEATGQGIIDFVSREGRVTFAVNKPLARQAGLELSPILLDVAEQVEH